jgi:hypothetical protein
MLDQKSRGGTEVKDSNRLWRSGGRTSAKGRFDVLVEVVAGPALGCASMQGNGMMCNVGLVSIE